MLLFGGNPAQAALAANYTHVVDLEKRWSELLQPFGKKIRIKSILNAKEECVAFAGAGENVKLQIDGVTVFSDTNKTADSHPPQELEAARGAELRIIATDENYCMQSMDPLLLHFGVGHVQELTDGWCRSACSEDACYDSEFEGPWPNEFLDETFVIEIP